MSTVVEVKNLYKYFPTPGGMLHAVDDVSFTIEEGKTLGVVGESGCGKSTLGRTIVHLLESTKGHIFLEGKDITHVKGKELAAAREDMQIMFQDPYSSLDPRKTIEQTIIEPLKVSKKYKKDEMYKKAQELMELVGIERAEERYHAYPYNFSGGMRQRSVMAIALASDPDLLFADEPTTALDVTIQAQILDLLREIQQKLGTATILVSHDLGVVARAADRVAVMYAGKIVEIGTAEEIYYDPRHPYTWGLMQSLPYFSKGKDQLYTIPGMPPSLVNPPKGDAYACRNEYALGIDYEEMPPMFQITHTHYAATWLLDKRAPKIIPPVGGKEFEPRSIS